MSVKVKRLEWEDSRHGEAEAHTPFGFFRVYNEAYSGSWGTFNAKWGGFIDGFTTNDESVTVEQAKAECQNWFDALVLECLEADNETN